MLHFVVKHRQHAPSCFTLVSGTVVHFPNQLQCRVYCLPQIKAHITFYCFQKLAHLSVKINACFLLALQLRRSEIYRNLLTARNIFVYLGIQKEQTVTFTLREFDAHCIVLDLALDLHI